MLEAGPVHLAHVDRHAPANVSGRHSPSGLASSPGRPPNSQRPGAPSEPCRRLCEPPREVTPSNRREGVASTTGRPKAWPSYGQMPGGGPRMAKSLGDAIAALKAVWHLRLPTVMAPHCNLHNRGGPVHVQPSQVVLGPLRLSFLRPPLLAAVCPAGDGPNSVRRCSWRSVLLAMAPTRKPTIKGGGAKMAGFGLTQLGFGGHRMPDRPGNTNSGPVASRSARGNRFSTKSELCEAESAACVFAPTTRLAACMRG